MRYSFLVSIILAIGFFSCQKSDITISQDPSPGSSTSTMTPIDTSNASKKILVDASKDGGGWWFPQGPGSGYSADNNHQGKALADYLRSRGYKVDELPRGAIITTDLLNKYSNVIRATAFFDYSTDEIAAYESFLNRSSSLLLINDHLLNSNNDRLSVFLGLLFEGGYWGPVTSFQSHPITAGVSSIPYIAGSVIRNWNPSKITVLGYLSSARGPEESTIGAMGIVHHPSSRIFFIGDVNGIEELPQPFVPNLVTWLFR